MKKGRGFDPTTLEIYRALYTSVAEEMGLTLRRTAHSPNIKERRDYSCAVFDRAGRVIAQGDHMPVHLGSMPMAVAAALEGAPPAPGDVVVLNDPFAGGTHLPDVTLVSGVFLDGRAGRPAAFYVANRAHHADIGGATPGSMGLATDVYGEGLRIPPVKLVRGGRMAEDVMRLLMANVRVERERRADFEAQAGSLKTGAARLLEIVARAGEEEAEEYARHLIDYSARMMRATVRAIPDGVYEAEDALDSDGVGEGEVILRVRVEVKGERAFVNFEGSAPQVSGPVNAVEAITVSAVAYVFRCLVGAGRGRERRDLAAHRGRSLQGPGAGAPRTHPRGEPGLDEQPDHRRHGPAHGARVRLLRDGRGRHGRAARPRRRRRRTHAHD
jgi:N-methylhydantoinase B